MIGSTFDIAGRATLGETTIDFEVFVVQDEDRRVIGLPMDLTVDDTTARSVGLSFAPVDPFEGDTVFDGIDFIALDEDGDGYVAIAPGSAAYNRLTRNLQIHDHYAVTIR